MRKHLSSSALYQQTQQTYIITEGKHLYPFARFQVSIQFFHLTEEKQYLLLCHCLLLVVQQLNNWLLVVCTEDTDVFASGSKTVQSKPERETDLFKKQKLGLLKGLKVGSTTLTWTFSYSTLNRFFWTFTTARRLNGKLVTSCKVKTMGNLLAVKAGTRRFLVCSVTPSDRQQPRATIRQHEWGFTCSSQRNVVRWCVLHTQFPKSRKGPEWTYITPVHGTDKDDHTRYWCKLSFRVQCFVAEVGVNRQTAEFAVLEWCSPELYSCKNFISVFVVCIEMQDFYVLSRSRDFSGYLTSAQMFLLRTFHVSHSPDHCRQ